MAHSAPDPCQLLHHRRAAPHAAVPHWFGSGGWPCESGAAQLYCPHHGHLAQPPAQQQLQQPHVQTGATQGRVRVLTGALPLAAPPATHHPPAAAAARRARPLPLPLPVRSRTHHARAEHSPLQVLRHPRGPLHGLLLLVVELLAVLHRQRPLQVGETWGGTRGRPRPHCSTGSTRQTRPAQYSSTAQHGASSFCVWEPEQCAAQQHVGLMGRQASAHAQQTRSNKHDTTHQN